MKLTYTGQDMINEFDKFGVGYKYPITGSYCEMSGFFASSTNIHSAFFAISDDDKLLIVELTILGKPQYMGIPLQSITSVKLKKSLIGHNYTAIVKFFDEGKEKRFDITMMSNNGFGKFPDQPRNVADMAAFLENLNG